MEYRYFVNKGEFFYEGQILHYFDIHLCYLGDVQIIKFIKHYHRVDKTPYLCVRIKFLDGCKTHITTFNSSSLGVLFTSKNFFDFSIDKDRE